MFRFVTFIPLEFWATVLLLLFMWTAFGLWGMVITIVLLVLIAGGGRISHQRQEGHGHRRIRPVRAAREPPRDIPSVLSETLDSWLD